VGGVDVAVDGQGARRGETVDQLPAVRLVDRSVEGEVFGAGKLEVTSELDVVRQRFRPAAEGGANCLERRATADDDAAGTEGVVVGDEDVGGGVGVILPDDRAAAVRIGAGDGVVP